MIDQDTSRQFVTLGLGDELFAIPVALVREILDMQKPFLIPEAPAHLVGLIDVRGQAVPVIDLRRKLGLPAKAATAETRILVLAVPRDGSELALGLIADRVIEVTALDEGSLSSAPQIGTRWRSDYIQAIGRRNGGFVVVFDLARLLASDAAALLQTPEARPPAAAEAAVSCA